MTRICLMLVFLVLTLFCPWASAITFAETSPEIVAETAPEPASETVRYDFDDADSLIDTTVDQGEWSVHDGQLHVQAIDGDATIFFNDPADWQNYELTVTAIFDHVKNRARWLSLIFRAGERGDEPWTQYPIRFESTESNGTECAVKKADGGWDVRTSAPAAEDCEIGIPVQLRIVVNGTTVHGFLNGEKTVTSHFCVDRDRGRVGLGVSGVIARFDNLVVRRLPDTKLVTRSPDVKCDVIAHRGFSEIAPENTLAAIREAIRCGADGCEFDVYACRDKQIVLMHDKDVRRTTDGEGDITQLTLAELQWLDAGSWKDRRFADERIPTLCEALELLKPSDCTAFIEIKMGGITQQVVREIEQHGMVDRSVIIAFDGEVVRDVSRLNLAIRCAWLCSKLPGDLADTSVERQADWLAGQAKEYRTGDPASATYLDLSYKLLSPELVRLLHERGIVVWCWTANDLHVQKSLVEWGVGGLTTDRPDQAIQLLRGQP